MTWADTSSMNLDVAFALSQTISSEISDYSDEALQGLIDDPGIVGECAQAELEVRALDDDEEE